MEFSGGEEGRIKKNASLHKCDSKINLYSKFLQNWTMGKYLNPGGKEGAGIQGEGNFEGKKSKRHKWHPKMNLYRKFHPHRTMGKC